MDIYVNNAYYILRIKKSATEGRGKLVHAINDREQPQDAHTARVGLIRWFGPRLYQRCPAATVDTPVVKVVRIGQKVTKETRKKSTTDEHR